LVQYIKYNNYAQSSGGATLFLIPFVRGMARYIIYLFLILQAKGIVNLAFDKSVNILYIREALV
jgi:hypothetical protein